MQPDVPAIHRAFDYSVPEALAEHVRIGTIVRVPLGGRRVRGWVLDDNVALPETDVSRIRDVRGGRVRRPAAGRGRAL